MFQIFINWGRGHIINYIFVQSHTLHLWNSTYLDAFCNYFLTLIYFSLSNHSCCANTSRTNYGRYGVVQATKTIFPNEKVYDNYGHFYHTDPKEQRQQVLAAQYFFSCNCQACKDDWPTYRDLSRREAEFLCYYCKYRIIDNLNKVNCRQNLWQDFQE